MAYSSATCRAAQLIHAWTYYDGFMFLSLSFVLKDEREEKYEIRTILKPNRRQRSQGCECDG